MLQLLLMVEKSRSPEWEDKLSGFLIKAHSSSSLSQKSVSCYKPIIPWHSRCLAGYLGALFHKKQGCTSLNSTKQTHLCQPTCKRTLLLCCMGWMQHIPQWSSQKLFQQGHSSWEGLKFGVAPVMPNSKNASSRLQYIRYSSSSSWLWDDFNMEVQICRRKGWNERGIAGKLQRIMSGNGFLYGYISAMQTSWRISACPGTSLKLPKAWNLPQRPGISLSTTKPKLTTGRLKPVPTN